MFTESLKNSILIASLKKGNHLICHCSAKFNWRVSQTSEPLTEEGDISAEIVSDISFESSVSCFVTLIFLF